MIPEDATTTKEVSTDKETKMIDLTGSWTLNRTLSDDASPALELQNVSWMIRKAISKAHVVMAITQIEDLDSGVLSLTSSQATLGRTVADTRVLDWDKELVASHPLFGQTRTRSRQVMTKDIIYDDYLVEAATEDECAVEILAESMDGTWKSHQLWRLEMVDGAQRQTRRAVVSNNGRKAHVRIVYDKTS